MKLHRVLSQVYLMLFSHYMTWLFLIVYPFLYLLSHWTFCLLIFQFVLDWEAGKEPSRFGETISLLDREKQVFTRSNQPEKQTDKGTAARMQSDKDQKYCSDKTIV